MTNKKTLFLLAQIVVIVSFMVNAHGTFASSQSQKNSPSPQESKSESHWTTVGLMSPLWTGLLDTAKLDKDQVILEGSFEITVTQDPSSFSEEFFSEIKNLEGLSGASFALADHPHLYSTKFSPNPFKKVSATALITFLDNKDLLRQALNPDIRDSDLAVYQDSWNFSDFFDRSDLLTIVSRGADGTSRITVAYLAVLNKNYTHSRLLGVTKSAVASQLQVQQKRSTEYFSTGKTTP